MADTDTIAGLDRRFGIPGLARVVEGNGALAKVAVTADVANGEIYLHGGHVTSWKPLGQEEVLFVSTHSRWEERRAIRGGVPVCFPWFGAKADDPQAPAHGFVRTKAWQLESIRQTEDTVTVSMFTESDETTTAVWPASFRLVHRATFGPVLSLELLMTNTGETPLRFEEALHAYFRVGDVERARVKGLDGVSYFDKTDNDLRKSQAGDITISAETDRVYFDTLGPVELEDPSLRRRIRVEKSNSSDTVVWNPWVDKAKALPDLGDDEWKQMVCIEGSNAGQAAVGLPPGAQHSMTVTVRVSRLAEAL